MVDKMAANLFGALENRTLARLDRFMFLYKTGWISRKFGFPTEQNGGHLFFEPLENRTSKHSDSNVFGTPMFGIQAPTVQ